MSDVHSSMALHAICMKINNLLLSHMCHTTKARPYEVRGALLILRLSAQLLIVLVNVVLLIKLKKALFVRSWAQTKSVLQQIGKAHPNNNFL